MAKVTNDVTYLTVDYSIGYDYVVDTSVRGRVKNIFTIEGETTPLYTLETFGVIYDMKRVIHEMIDNYLKLEATIDLVDAYKTEFEEWDGDLDTFLSENPNETIKPVLR